MSYNVEGTVPEEKIEELEQAVKEAFPRNMKVDVRINPDGRVRIFEVETMLEENDSRDHGFAFKMLLDMNYTSQDIEAELKKNRWQDGDPETLFPYIQKINLDLKQFEVEQPFVDKLKQNLMAEASLEYYLTDVAKAIEKHEEQIINECLPEPITMQEFKNDGRLSFILSSAKFNHVLVNSYDLNNPKDVESMFKNIGEYGVLYRIVRKYPTLAAKFMNELRRRDIELLEELIKIFNNVFSEVVAGEIKFLEEFLNETITSFHYTKIGKHYVMNTEV